MPETPKAKAAPAGHPDVVRALLDVFEAGDLNTRQMAAIHQVRVILGDAEGLGCPHENTAFEKGDVLVCQDCREELPVPAPMPAGNSGATERKLTHA